MLKTSTVSHIAWRPLRISMQNRYSYHSENCPSMHTSWPLISGSLSHSKYHCSDYTLERTP